MFQLILYIYKSPALDNNRFLELNNIINNNKLIQHRTLIIGDMNINIIW